MTFLNKNSVNFYCSLSFSSRMAHRQYTNRLHGVMTYLIGSAFTAFFFEYNFAVVS